MSARPLQPLSCAEEVEEWDRASCLAERPRLHSARASSPERHNRSLELPQSFIAALAPGPGVVANRREDGTIYSRGLTPCQIVQPVLGGALANFVKFHHPHNAARGAITHSCRNFDF